MSQNQGDDLVTKNQWMSVAFVFFAGIALSVGGFYGTKAWEDYQARQDFNELAHRFGMEISGLLEEHLQEFQAVADSFPSAFTNQEEFDQSVSSLLKTQGSAHAVAWVPKIEGLTEGNFHVRFIHPLHENKELVGLDLESDPLQLETMAKACDTGKQNATHPIQEMLKNNRHSDGLFVYLPVYRSRPDPVGAPRRCDNLAGFVLHIYDLEKMVSHFVKKILPEEIHMKIYDSSRRPLNLSEVGYTHEFNFAGADVSLFFTPTLQYEKEHASSLHWWVFAVGLLMTVTFVICLADYVHETIEMKKILQQVRPPKPSQPDPPGI